MLRIEEARKRFGDVQALDDCTFSISRGHMLGFLGPNGAGKTTTMRAIFGLVELDDGKVVWDGRAIRSSDRLRFGYMPEERGLYPRMPVGEQVAYFGRLHGLSVTDARKATDGWLERLGLANRATAKLEELSHGNQQRAQLAAALVHEPELLVLDEPFAGLDPVAVQTLADVLRGEATRGAAVLFSSHQLDLVEDICEDVAIIDHGRVVGTGDVQGLRHRSRHRVVEVQLDAEAAEWAPSTAGVRVLERRNGIVRLAAERDVEPERLLSDAVRAGHMTGFSYGPPSLAELFLELVAR